MANAAGTAQMDDRTRKAGTQLGGSKLLEASRVCKLWNDALRSVLFAHLVVTPSMVRKLRSVFPPEVEQPEGVVEQQGSPGSTAIPLLSHVKSLILRGLSVSEVGEFADAWREARPRDSPLLRLTFFEINLLTSQAGVVHGSSAIGALCAGAEEMHFHWTPIYLARSLLHPPASTSPVVTSRHGLDKSAARGQGAVIFETGSVWENGLERVHLSSRCDARLH
ncbi:hypothetical protein DFJ73DRAFT_846671 [Zopfochytrium polystomum]|nr:hypothetical protein DFJ73DRAFT_846671 [Zopfochytrium polystomum]